MGFFTDVNPQSINQASDGFREFQIGDNHAYISKVEEKLSESGNPMLEITFTDEHGTNIRYYIVDGEFKLSRLKQLYTAFSIPSGETDTRKWLGKWAIVVCKKGEPYNGKVYNKVHYVRPVNGGALPKTMPPEESYTSQPDEFADDIPF